MLRGRGLDDDYDDVDDREEDLFGSLSYQSALKPYL